MECERPAPSSSRQCWSARPRLPSSRLPRVTSRLLTGRSFIVRQNTAIAAKPGDPVFAIDTLRTEADGTIGVTMMDDTRISLGPASEVRLERYVFAPAEGGLGMVLNFVRGVAAYVSGRMAKLAPDSIRLETPAAIVGVRGTTVAIRVGS